MPLSAGDKLGHYEILSLLGKGGMGEVYRGRDTKLKRDVALKVLPSAFASDPERMDRFQREAEVLASLNHPGIASIYGVEDRALVMELVEGESPKGPLPFDNAWKIAAQIAAALEYAHEKGIVHRDLKPANIKITPEGVVKLLDFGLAKAFTNRGEGRSSASDGAENSPTLTIGATEVGVILGTAAYMPPEQAKGKSVDKRADIWSFGVVLYELLTGERLFKGEDVSETLAHVLTKQPDLEKAPPETRKLLRRCLEKDPRKRLRDIGDAWDLLEDGKVSTTSAPSRARFGLLWPGVAGLAIVAALGVSFLHFRETPPEVRAVNTTLLPPGNAEFDFTAPHGMPAISPDGTRIVYGARGKDGKQQLWLRRLDSAAAQPLPGTDGAATPFWSPDSRWVGFGQENKLKKIDIQGGPPVPLTDLTAPLRGGSWNSQGVIVFGVNTGGPIQRIAASGGTAAPATVVETDTRSSHRHPWFLPDGRHFLYMNSQANGDLPIFVGSLDEPGKPGKVVVQAHSPAVYSMGYLLYLRENTLMAQPFDPDRLATTGEAAPVAEGVPTFTTGSRIPGFAVSPGGLLVFQTGESGAQSRLVWKDRQGKVLGNLGEATSPLDGIALSPDGKRVAASNYDRNGGNEDLWLYDVERGIRTRFTFDPRVDYEPAWSPDGNTLYFGSNRKGSYNLFRKASNGAGTEELVFEDSTNKVPNSVSPDGKLLLFRRLGPKTGNDLLVLPVTQAQSGAKPEPRVFLQTLFSEQRGQFSPDGQWVAYSSNESAQTQVYAAPFPGPGGKRQISSGGGNLPRWRRDGKEIFYATADGQMMAAEVAVRNGTLEVENVQRLFDGIITNRNMTYDVSGDGQKFLVVDEGLSAIRPLTLLQNWTASLRK